MDSYKLAELAGLIPEKKFKIHRLHEKLEKIDVSACISDELQVFQSGFNCLHLSVLENDEKLTQKLLDRGANLLQQGTQNGYTPLCAFIAEKPYDQDRNVGGLQGTLGKHPIVDLLLNEQVKRNQALNPKCFRGLSHLHIACMVDHSQAVEMFLKAGESLNQAIGASIPSFTGFTPLHMAVRYSSVKAAKLLIYHGADINQKDAEGVSSLHHLIERLTTTSTYTALEKPPLSIVLTKELKKLELIVGFFLETKTKSKVNFVSNLEHSAFNVVCMLDGSSVDEETLREDIDVNKTLNNFVDNLGMSAFHVACTLRNPSMVQEFLKTDIDVNKPLTGPHKESGLNALHLAACCSVETVKLLIQHGGDITLKSNKYDTPLDICTSKYSPAVIHSVLSTKEEYREILLNDGSTKLLDLLLAMENCDEFQSFLQNMPDINATIPFDSPIWPGYNVLHLAIEMHQKIKISQDYIESLVILNKYIEQQYTNNEDEDKNYWKRIVICLARRCSLVSKNAAGLTPVHLAFQRHKANVVDKLLNSCSSLGENVMNESSGLSFLHMACTIGKKNVVERFVNDINTPIKTGFDWCKNDVCLQVRADSTPLHIALMCGNREIVEYLLQQKNIDVYAKDSMGFTPIHLSAVSPDMANMFLNKTVNLRETVSQDGLSHLHVAAIVDNDKVIDTLVRNGAKVNVAFRPHEDFDRDDFGKFFIHAVRDTPLHVAVKRNNWKAVSALIRAGADIHATSFKSKYNTPLQAAMQNEYDDRMLLFIKKLRKGRWIEGPLEPCGVTLLHFACATFNLKWAKILLERGADPNAQICMDEDYRGDWKGFAALHVLIDKVRFIKEKKKNLTELVMLLLKHGAKVTLQDELGYTPLLMAEKYTDEALLEEKTHSPEQKFKISEYMLPIADLLMKSQQSFAVNPTTHREGSSHFHYGCKTDRIDVVKMFIRYGVDVNRGKRAVSTGDGGFTPLHFALSSNSKKVAWLLLDQKVDVSARDLRGNTALHFAASHVDDVRLLEKIYSLGADIKATNYADDATPLDTLLHSDCISYDKFKFFLDHGCSLEFDNESDMNIIGLLLSNADPFDRKNIFLSMFESCGLAEKIKNGFNAIKSLVGFTPNATWSASRCWTVDMFLEAIQFFIDMGCDLNHQNYQGKTALHEAVGHGNIEATQALLLLGANISIRDKQGYSAFDTIEWKVEPCTDLFSRLIIINAMHVWKMNFVGLNISMHNKMMAKQAWDINYSDITIQQRCEDELKRLVQIKVGEKWTLKDFLSETKAVIEYQFLTLEERQPVDEFFKCHANLRKNFPEFCGILMAQYRKAVDFVDIYGSVKNAIAKLIKLELPEECFIELLKKITIVALSNKIKEIEDSFERAFV